jgi:16S rRNA G966 N2-methylase RsmD
LLFLDPPFPLYREQPGRVHALLASLLTTLGCEDGAVAVLRVPADAEVPCWPAGIEEVERRPAGESMIILLHRDS